MRILTRAAERRLYRQISDQLKPLRYIFWAAGFVAGVSVVLAVLFIKEEYGERS